MELIVLQHISMIYNGILSRAWHTPLKFIRTWYWKTQEAFKPVNIMVCCSFDVIRWRRDFSFVAVGKLQSFVVTLLLRCTERNVTGQCILTYKFFEQVSYLYGISSQRMLWRIIYENLYINTVMHGFTNRICFRNERRPPWQNVYFFRRTFSYFVIDNLMLWHSNS
jgi:hypothetical protein